MGFYMGDENKTKVQLIEELEEIRKLIPQFEELEKKHHKTEKNLINALISAKAREKEISSLLKGSRAVLENRKFEDSARKIFDICADLIGATAGYVALLSPDGSENELVFLEAGGKSCNVDPSLPMPIRGLRSEAFQFKKAVYENDFFKSKWMKFMPRGHARLENVLFAPLVIEKKAVGLLGMANKEGGFTDDDARIASAFGELAAVALLNSRTMESLERSESRYKGLFDFMSSGVAVYEAVEGGRDFVFKDFNKAGEGIEKLKRQDIIGKKVTDVFPGVKEYGFLEIFQKVWKTGNPEHYPLSVYKDKRISGWRENYVYKLPSGEVVAVYDDITERKKYEEALIESEKKARAISDNSMDAIIVMDGDGVISYFNPAAEKIFGYEAGEVFGKKLHDLLVSEKSRKEYYKRLPGFKKTGKCKVIGKTIELEAIRKDGSKFPLELSVTSFEIRGNWHSVGTARDITQKKKTDEKIQNQNDFLNTIIESLPYPFYVIDAGDYSINMANSAATDRNILIGSKCHLVTHNSNVPCKSNEHKCPLEEVKKTKKPVIVDHIHTDEDGKPKYYEVHGYPIFDKNDNIIQMIEYSIDVTQRKKAENDIIRYTKELEESNKLKDLFTDIMRHDLSNPVSVIGSFTTMIREETDPEEIRRMLVIVARNVERVHEMIENSANLAKLGAVEEIERESLDLNEIVDDCVSILDLKIKERGVKIERKLPKSFSISVAPFFEDVMMNLISNAVKHTPEGSRVAITGEKGKDTIRIQVSDNGEGVPDKYKDKIFDRFNRREKFGVKGSGLGLSIVKIIMDLHGGKVWVEENPGGGARFVVELPQ